MVDQRQVRHGTGGTALRHGTYQRRARLSCHLWACRPCLSGPPSAPPRRLWPFPCPCRRLWASSHLLRPCCWRVGARRAANCLCTERMRGWDLGRRKVNGQYCRRMFGEGEIARGGGTWRGRYGENVGASSSSQSHSPSAKQSRGDQSGERAPTSRNVQNYSQPRTFLANDAFTAAQRPPTRAAMKLNVKNIRYVTPEDWRVLTAVCALRVPVAAAVGTDADEDAHRQNRAAVTTNSCRRR